MGDVVANGRFELIGTPAQTAILMPVFTAGASEFIRFPWALMDDLPRYPVPISWEDLNDGTLAKVATDDTGSTAAPVHPHFHDSKGFGHAISRPGATLGEPEARNMIAGVFWTDGRIKIDTRMEGRPDDAREVLSAELAHAVDYGLPITDAMKGQIVELLHPGGADTHTWWERASYGDEYYTLVGEGFMAVFTHAYSSMEPWQDPFTHKSTREVAARVPAILGAAPVGTEATPETIRVFQIKGYRAYHENASTRVATDDCRFVRNARASGRSVGNGGLIVHASQSAARSLGLKPCGICKPG